MSVTLHDEMADVLRKAGRPMTSTEIAEFVNKRKNYIRRDGGPVPASQIRARANNYLQLFELVGTQISLRSRG